MGGCGGGVWVLMWINFFPFERDVKGAGFKKGGEVGGGERTQGRRDKAAAGRIWGGKAGLD